MIYILKHFWIAFILVNIINHFIGKQRIKKYIDQNPNLQAGYDRIFNTKLIFGNIPWLIMGIADFSGYTQSIFDFFRPKDMNPFVLVFHAYVITLLLLMAGWVYFKQGAEFLAQHPGIITVNKTGKSSEPGAKEIKLFLAFSLVGGFAAIIIMWVADFPGFPQLK